MGFWDKFFNRNCDRCKQLEERLFAEIDSNRLRESELINITLRLQEIHKLAPLPGQRTPLNGGSLQTFSNTQPQQSQNEQNEDGLDENRKKQLNEVAEQFIKSAEERGTPYTEDAKILLREALYREPEKYLG